MQTFVPANTALNKYSIADLGLWLDATDLDGDGTTDSVTSGTTVSSWTDKSVGGETVSQSTAENMPTRQANSFGSKAAVRFDGNGDILNVSTIRAESGGYSAYAAVRRPSTSGDASGHLVSESGWNLAPSGSNAGFPAIIAKKSGTAGTLTNIKLGKSASSTSNDFGGDLGELLIFSRQLTATEEQKVEGYLAHKWGATDSLEANHPYKNVAPTFDNKPLINIDSLQADAIKVDFGRNTTPPLQAGYVGFNPWGSSSSDNGNLVEQTYSNSFGNSNSLKVSVSGQTHWRDYNTITGGPFLSLNNLLSDEVLRNSNGTITIKLSDVKAGEYSVSTYHHASQSNGNTTYDLKVTDASGTNRLIAANMTSSGGQTPSTINKQTFDVVSDGSNDIQIMVGPGGANNNHLVVNGFDLLAKGYISIETGSNVSIQVPATRNPTSWSASGLPTGLSINNSGVISGSTSTLGNFNATITAINADGNDSKTLGIAVIKGNRSITWDKTIAGLTYGDSALSLTGTATGTDVSGLPAVLPNLKLWLDASDSSSVTHSSNAVSQWSDKSGNGIHATQSTASRKPTFNSTGTNGKSVIDFDGSSDFLNASGLSITQSYTFALVAKTNNNSTGRDFLFDGVGNNRSIIALDNSGKVQMWATSWGNTNLNTPSGYFVMTAVFNSSSSSLSLNGTSVTGLNTGTSNLSGGIRIGAHKDTSDFLKGSIAEFFILDETSNANTIAKVEGYLAHKWGLAGSLPSEHAYKATAPQTGFHYVSSNSNILEINGTSAILRAGGAVTITANAPENASAFAAVPVSKEVSIAKADLALSGQNLSISLGDSIPDLNWTASGWKHNDASLAIGTHPNNLSSLALWLDATDSSTITQSSNVVSQWNDKSGSNYHASQSTADRQPMVNTNSIGGKTAILFDGSDSMGASTRLGLGTNPALTVFVVCNIFTDNNTDDRIFHIGGSSNSLSVGGGSEGWAWRYDGGNERYGSVSHGTDYILAYTRPSSGNFASAKLFVNGTEQTRTSGANDSTSPTSTTANFKIGSNYNGGGNFVNGYIGEIIVIGSDSNSDRYGIEGYLAHKWGMSASLPSNHTHKTVSLIRGPKVTTDANSSSPAGTYAVTLSDAMSDKYTFTYSTDGELVISSLTEQTIAWGQSFSGVGVGQTVDLNASASSNLAVLYSVDDTSVAELAVTNQSALKAWWKLDEATGVDASDSSAFSSIGSVENSTTGHWNAGKFGNAITLDGTNDHLRVYGYTGIYGTAGRTVALWFKTSTANKPLLQYGTSGTGTLFKLSLNSSGAAVLDLGGATISSSTSGLADGNWHHLAVSFPSADNSSGAKLYVDSTGTNGSGTTTINTNSSKDVIIGRDGDAGSGYFNGQIDDVRFYDGEMNSTLVGQLYGNGNGDFNRLKIKAAGSVTITATQPGNSSYAPAPSTTLTATFNKSDQTISFDVIPCKSVGDFQLHPHCGGKFRFGC